MAATSAGVPLVVALPLAVVAGVLIGPLWGGLRRRLAVWKRTG